MRRHLDRLRRGDVTLILTEGLRVPSDFAKAMALGADGIALGNCLDDLSTWKRDMAYPSGVPYGGATPL